jgi:hypothetical protein
VKVASQAEKRSQISDIVGPPVFFFIKKSDLCGKNISVWNVNGVDFFFVGGGSFANFVA